MDAKIPNSNTSYPPPSTCKKWLRSSLYLTFFIVLVTGCVSWLPGGLYRCTTNDQPVIITIHPKESRLTTARRLSSYGLIAHPWFMMATSCVLRFFYTIPAGDYKIAPHTKVLDLLMIMNRGQTKVFQLTIVEGWTIFQVCAAINRHPDLVGAIFTLPAEGHVLPQTYRFSYQTRRQDLLDRMSHAMGNALENLWSQRLSGFFLKSKEEALTLASIIEKETSIAAEYPLIASVFLNRLKKGMPLQSDPTVSYALTQGTRHLGRLLNKKDLLLDNPYNSYRFKGLPPGPISCPRLSCLEAVFYPSTTCYFYFVAARAPKDGHVFSEDYQTHQEFVRQWRQQSKTKTYNEEKGLNTTKIDLLP